MELTDKLSPDELKAIAPILDDFSERARFSISLDYLLEGWKSFVLEVENGYGLSIYDYTNDLGHRSLLEDLLCQVPQSLSDKLMEPIQVWDRHFMEATQEIEHPLRGHETKEQAFWQYRIPKHLVGELKEDLQSEAIIP